MLSGYLRDITDTTADAGGEDGGGDGGSCQAVVLNCRLYRRGEGWGTRQER